ncbi:YfiT family bacillithiol transferase [Flammeovirga sp. SubArs3]|uniref:YfiT family bacillithiol transferase n=1 Tax=Flammeovirga sp. SubArs3 TaxID=2995316 RepID=UPI00248B0E4D|nr:putative metal-dependent hydrolase [Flammeovirga sp. SubArs3]
MQTTSLQQLKFPIGECPVIKHPSKQEIEAAIQSIEVFPQLLESTLNGVSNEALNYRYRPDGWKVKQVVHHCADSHMNSIIRFKLALTEDIPHIRPYHEHLWAELNDSLSDDLSDTLLLLKGLHNKWASLLKSLTESDLLLEFEHPEHGTRFNLGENIMVYDWHCRHHLAHIRQGLESEGKYN